MAAGAGLAVLALVVTGLHFVTVLGYSPMSRWVSTRSHAERTYTITYEDGRGVLRALLTTSTTHTWTVHSVAIVNDRSGYGEDGGPLVAVALTLSGPRVTEATAILGTVEGVVRVDDGHVDDE